MKKRYIVKSNILFNNIIQKGKQNKNKYFVLCGEKNNDYNRFGIAVGTKVGNAVKRNKIKRQVRSIIDNNIKLFPKTYNYIIICKKEVLTLSYREMENKLLELIEKDEKNEK